CNENLDVTSVVFEVTFPSGVLADYANASLSSRSNGHVLTCDTLGNNAFRFTIANDSLWALTSTSGKLMMIPVTLPSDWKAGSNYPVIFGAAVLGTTSGQLVCPVRNGSVGITPVASSLYASFYTDIHLNRVQFTNMSSGTASTYQWDFGDGQTSTEKNPMHVYAMSGTYSVTLTVSDGANLTSVKLDVSIVKEANWTMEGYYTLNKHRTNVKNFTSGLELFSTLSNCSITGNIMIQVEAGETFDLPLDSSVNVLFGRLGEKLLVKGGPQLTFISEKADSTALLSFSGVLNRMYIETILTTAANFRFDDVEMAFSGLKLNVTALNGVNDITTCSGHTTPQVDLSLLGNQFEVHWMLSGEPLNLTGQQNSGSGVIPSMILYSTATYTNRLTYTIQLISNSYIFYEKNINYDIRPSLQVFPKALAPVGNAMLELPQVTFNWQSQDNAAYDLFIWEIGTPEPVVPVVRDIWSAPYTDTHICQYGKAYKWKVLARSSCDSIWSQVDSFHIGLLPDLKVESITLSKTGVYAGEELDVQVLVHNAGGKIFGNYWSDQLYLVSGANLQNRWPVSSTWRWRSLASDSSYQVSFHVTMPLDTVSYTAFLFVADNQYNLAEGNDFNNLKFSEPLSLRHYTIEETDYNSLKLLYEKTNGSGWNNRWTVSSNLLLSRNWPGVGFERGHVTSIDLTQNNLVGQLPAGLFNLPYLRTLILANNNLSGRLDVLADSIKLHGYRCDSLKNINLGYNSFAGEVSSFANLFQGLNQLNLESNRLSEIDTVLSSGISALNLQNQVFTHPDIPLSMIPSLEIPSLFWYRHDTKELKRNDLVFYLMKDGRYLGWIYYNSPSYTLNLYNEWTYAPGDSFNLVQSNSYFYGSKATVHLSFKAGDANIDQQTDILDVQHTLNRIFSDYCYPFNRYAANTYVDDQITVQDIVATVNILLETGVVVDTTQKATLRAAYTGNSLYIANGKLMLDVQVPVSALDISLKSLRDNQVGLLLNSDDFQMIARNTTDGVRFIIYSGDGKEIPAGSTEVAQLASAQAKLMYASLANRQAQAVPVQIANIPTDRPIVDEPLIEAFLNPHSLILRLTQPVEKLTVQIYNMQGILISQQERNQLTAGSHLFDYARTLSSGLYLLKLICNNGETVLTKNYKWIVSK
ncbi:MAG: PKD domain-containing protein, partial [Bacteroidota bacterium]|nr:PKD domain-containing protein [Bacteroidota bacterium]